MNTNFIKSIFILTAGFGILCCTKELGFATESKEAQSPNIVIFMTDDAGYSDISLYGSEIHTPNMDQLANKGLIFRTFYNNARCSPTRASLLTGQYAHKVGVGDLCGEQYATDLPGYRGYLKPTDNVTLAELLADEDYETLLSGKWHLGGAPNFPASAGSHPLRRGFNKFYGILGPDADYFTPEDHWDGFERATAEVTDGQWFSEDVFGDRAVAWVEEAVAQEKPFFLYLSFKAPHNPRQALDEDYTPYLTLYEKSRWPVIMEDRVNVLKERQIIPEEWGANTFEFDEAYYENMPALRAGNLQEIAAIKAGAIVSADRNIGKVMEALDRLDQRRNTLVIFFSDNGSALAHDLNNIWNSPFRGGKGELTQGGIVSHCIIHWPEMIQKQRLITDAVGILDIMPTVLDVVGVDYPTQWNGRSLPPLAGVSFFPLLKGGSVFPLLNGGNFNLNDRKLYWELYGQKAVIQDSRWKFYQSYNRKTGDTEEFLFDLQSDGTELNNLINTPQGRKIAENLRDDWNAWADEVGAVPYPDVQKARKGFSAGSK